MPQTSASRSLGITCHPRLHIPGTISSVQFSHSVISNSLGPRELQHARPPCPSPTPRVHPNSCAIQPSHPPLSPSPPALNPSQHQRLFQWVNSSHEMAKVLEFQLQHHSFQRNPRADLLQNGLFGSPCSPRDSQNFKSINSSAEVMGSDAVIHTVKPCFSNM